MDLEDAQRAARYRQQLRHAGIDSGTGAPVDGSGPSERAVDLAAEIAVRSFEVGLRAAPDGEFDPVGVAKGIRGRWLHRNYRRMT